MRTYSAGSGPEKDWTGGHEAWLLSRILITLRATGELKLHFPIALCNGLTEDEIAEAIYHSSAYAGFPAASSALSIAKEALGK